MLLFIKYITYYYPKNHTFDTQDWSYLTCMMLTMQVKTDSVMRFAHPPLVQPPSKPHLYTNQMELVQNPPACSSDHTSREISEQIIHIYGHSLP